MPDAIRESNPTSEFFDARSQSWSDLYRDDPRFARRFERIATLLQRYVFSTTRPGSALDVGCGSGPFSRFLAANGWEVVGIDASIKMIEEAEHSANSGSRLISGGSLQFIHSRLEEFDRPAESFDLIVSFSMLEYIEDDRAALGKLAKLLKQGGNLVISVPNQHGLLRKVEKGIFALRNISGDRIAKGRAEYLKVQRHQYQNSEFDTILTRLGLKKLDSAYLNAGINLPRAFLRIFERRWWAAMYCGVYVKL
jgi:2-polyprenyl-3-methyl-5-hydroxy-6-metoxy-1,4-benzoquinol methylase